ncbi:MAG: ATP-binding protein [Cohaesibacter sp.]|jgi:PAS domain S-box-containing protein|nr:ATP-binding protein [Cohaesibacter sp.]
MPALSTASHGLPFLTLTAHPSIGAVLLDPRPAWVWNHEGNRIIWSNAAGLAFFNETSMDALLDRTFGDVHPARRHLARLALNSRPNTPLLDRLRFFLGVKAVTTTCLCKRLEVAGESMVLVLSTDAQVEKLSEEQAARKLVDALSANPGGMADPDKEQILSAIMDGDSKVLAASDGFESLVTVSEKIDMLLQGADGETGLAIDLLDEGDEPRVGGVARTGEGSAARYMLLVSSASGDAGEAVDFSALEEDDTDGPYLSDEDMAREADIFDLTDTDSKDTLAPGADKPNMLEHMEAQPFHRDRREDNHPTPQDPAKHDDKDGGSSDRDGIITADNDDVTSGEAGESGQKSPQQGSNIVNLPFAPSPADIRLVSSTADVTDLTGAKESKEGSHESDEAKADLFSQDPAMDGGDIEDQSRTSSVTRFTPKDALEDISTKGADEESSDAFTFDPSAGPHHFIWESDEVGRFTFISSDLADAVGPEYATILGKTWPDIAAEFSIHDGDEIAAAFEARDTWTGLIAHWPVQNSELAIAVEMTGLPVFGRFHGFQGFRGFGICRSHQTLSLAELGTEDVTTEDLAAKSASSTDASLATDDDAAQTNALQSGKDVLSDEVFKAADLAVRTAGAVVDGRDIDDPALSEPQDSVEDETGAIATSMQILLDEENSAGHELDDDAAARAAVEGESLPDDSLPKTAADMPDSPAPSLEGRDADQEDMAHLSRSEKDAFDKIAEVLVDDETEEGPASRDATGEAFGPEDEIADAVSAAELSASDDVADETEDRDSDALAAAGAAVLTLGTGVAILGSSSSDAKAETDAETGTEIGAKDKDILPEPSDKARSSKKKKKAKKAKEAKQDDAIETLDLAEASVEQASLEKEEKKHKKDKKKKAKKKAKLSPANQELPDMMPAADLFEIAGEEAEDQTEPQDQAGDLDAGADDAARKAAKKAAKKAEKKRKKKEAKEAKLREKKLKKAKKRKKARKKVRLAAALADQASVAGAASVALLADSADSNADNQPDASSEKETEAEIETEAGTHEAALLAPSSEDDTSPALDQVAKTDDAQEEAQLDLNDQEKGDSVAASEEIAGEMAEGATAEDGTDAPESQETEDGAENADTEDAGDPDDALKSATSNAFRDILAMDPAFRHLQKSKEQTTGSDDEEDSKQALRLRNKSGPRFQALIGGLEEEDASVADGELDKSGTQSPIDLDAEMESKDAPQSLTEDAKGEQTSKEGPSSEVIELPTGPSTPNRDENEVSFTEDHGASQDVDQDTDEDGADPLIATGLAGLAAGALAASSLGEDDEDNSPKEEALNEAAAALEAELATVADSEVEATQPETAAPDFDQTQVTALLDKLPTALLISADQKVRYATSTALSLLGFDSATALQEAGGMDALFAGRPGDWLTKTEGRTTLRKSDGSPLSVLAQIASTQWNNQPAAMLTFEKAPNDPPSIGLSEEDEKIAELEAILDTATDGVVVLDANACVLRMNHSAEALFEVDRHDMAGESFLDLLAEESHKDAVDYLDGLVTNGVASVLNDGREVIGRVSSGGLIPLFMTMGRVAIPGTNRFCAVVRDIAQWKRAEEDLLAEKRRAEKANNQKSDFLAKISHEIRTPLNAIIGFSEVMIDERFGEVGNERYKDYLKDIHTSGSHIMSLINDLLDLSKVEAGKMDLSFQATELNALVQESVGLMQPQANREQIIIRTSLSSALPDVVGDSRSLRQIILNLLSNGVKYTPAGGQVIISTSYEENGEVILRIRDTGIGMSEDEVKTALEPFRQLSSTSSKSNPGTGLGLPLTKALVEANRARFSLVSAKDHGTLVEITFPNARVLAG